MLKTIVSVERGKDLIKVIDGASLIAADNI